MVNSRTVLKYSSFLYYKFILQNGKKNRILTPWTLQQKEFALIYFQRYPKKKIRLKKICRE